MNEKTLSYKGYCGSVEVSIEDDCLHGKLLFVNDLVTYEADAPAQLEKAFQDAVEYYLEKCARDNLIPDKPFSGSFNVRMTPALHRAAAMKAARNGSTLNDYVRECVASSLEDGRGDGR